MSRFLVAGITQIETIVMVDSIPVRFSPLTSIPDTIHTSAGGDAYNESLALKWLGHDVDFLSVIGRNQDRSVLNPMDREVTLSTEYILPLLVSTPTQVILYDRDRKQQIFEDIKNLRDAEYDMSMVPPLVAASDMVVLSTANFCRPFIEQAQKFNKPIVVNIHDYEKYKERFSEDFLNAASILYFSDDTISGDPFEFVKGMAAKYDPDIIILGQGAEGLILYDKEKNTYVHYNTVSTNEVINTAGAGNALLACFLHCYAAGADAQEAIKKAMLFASYKIGYMGTSNGFLTEEQLDQWWDLIWGQKTPDDIIK